MINITTLKSEIYSYDPDTLRVFKDGVLLSSSKVEPVFTSSSTFGAPVFSGIYVKDRGTVISLGGSENKAITDINLVD